MKNSAIYGLVLAGSVALSIISLPVEASEADHQIKLSARRSYVFRTYLGGENIRIRAKDSVVTLEGTVCEESHKAMAEETVSNIPGVKSVHNKLIVTGSPVRPGSDAWLTERVRYAMLLHRDVNYAYSGVSVTAGHVTLRGFASSEDQRQLTTLYAKEVPGVEDVDNRMIVAKSLANPPRSSDPIMDDASVTSQVKMSLVLCYGTEAFDARVSTHAGIVTLSGLAENQAQIDHATTFVANINGVRGVKNQLTIRALR